MQDGETIESVGTTRKLTAIRDFPDIRDRFFEPPLIELAADLAAPPELVILDQGAEGACTGFATAAALNLLRQRQGALLAPEGASPRMIYEMAKLHDEWEGQGYEGSSVRGAIKGFFHNGVCREQDAPYLPGDSNWVLSVAQAKQARQIILGSYYRLRPVLVDYHAALQQAGAIVVSANIHSGWANPKRGHIRPSTRTQGGHAFTIVGYDAEGFIIQNSWGHAWGGFLEQAGLAHWSYHDWAETVVDAWVMRLAVPTPNAFELTHRVARPAGMELPQDKKHTPRRQDVIGHIIHIDDGHLVETGQYGTPMASLEETAKLLRQGAEGDERKYDHILFYAHGGVTDANAAARKTAAMRDGFKRNGIYPIHFIWETGLIEEVTDILFRKAETRGGRITGFEEAMDFLIEKLSAGIGRALWREMKADAHRSFASGAQSAAAVRSILSVNEGLARPLKIHLVGHSAGSNFVGEFIAAWQKLAPASSSIDNCFVLGAACTVAQYEAHFRPSLDGSDLKHLTVYNLSEERECADTVGPYSKSLLYLVSHAFEEAATTPLLGMEIHATKIPKHKHQDILHTSGKDTRRTDAKSHGGYGSDLTTLNDILKVVCGDKYRPSLAFRAEELASA
ncbi:C1 family peptidase [Devosia sp.]|uniref:C1 family peptidase n=1 Tax=Devosia sp. TaxID=1871048 RepID=UPI002733BE4D|nr:C1 family peptidase [Devosia sp.]MDP2779274.1 C1 family peptidase [Devosia sp.]